MLFDYINYFAKQETRPKTPPPQAKQPLSIVPSPRVILQRVSPLIFTSQISPNTPKSITWQVKKNITPPAIPHKDPTNLIILDFVNNSNPPTTTK